MYNGDYRGYLIERLFDGNYGMDILGGIANEGDKHPKQRRRGEKEVLLACNAEV